MSITLQDVINYDDGLPSVSAMRLNLSSNSKPVSPRKAKSKKNKLVRMDSKLFNFLEEEAKRDTEGNVNQKIVDILQAYKDSKRNGI